MDRLTPKQKAFADEYLKCGNATEFVVIEDGRIKDFISNTGFKY